MQSKECQRFSNQVKSHFAYLFDQFNFSVVYQDEAIDSLGTESCLIVLESEECRIKIYRSHGEVNVQFGTLSAPLSWQDHDSDTGQWYYLRGLLSFLRNEKFNIDILLKRKPSWKTDEQQMAELSRELKPVCLQIISLFQEDNYPQWKMLYDQYQEEQEREFRKQYRHWEGKRT